MYFVFVVIVIVVKCHGAMLAGVHACAQVFTMPEYLRMRFGGQRIRIYLAILALLLSVFTKIAVSLSLSLSLSLSFSQLFVTSCFVTTQASLTHAERRKYTLILTFISISPNSLIVLPYVDGLCLFLVCV